jgi:hypothetical protein
MELLIFKMTVVSAVALWCLGMFIWTLLRVVRDWNKEV